MHSMRHGLRSRPVANIVFLLCGLSLTLPAQTNLYWDLNGGTAGSGATGGSVSDTWNPSASRWNTNSTGGAGSISSWIAGSNAYFSAGSDATGISTITVSGSQTVRGIFVEEGTMSFTGGTFNNLSNFDVSSGLTTTVSTTMAGNANFEKTGTGTLILTAANSHQGVVTVSAGTLVARNTAALGTGYSAATVTDGGTLALENNITLSESLVISGSGAGNNGALRNLSGNNTYDTSITLANHSRIQSDSGNLSLTGYISGSTRNLTFGGAGNITFTGGIAVRDVIKTDGGMLTINAPNNNDGRMYFNGGTVRISSDGNLGAYLGSFTADKLVFNGGTLNTTASLTINPNRGITLNTDGGTLNINNGTTLTYGGRVTGVGSLTKTGTGTLTLSGANSNTFTGPTYIDDGTLVLDKTAGVNALSSSHIFVGNGSGATNSATLTLNASNQIINTADVTVNTDGRLNLNNRSETIDSLTTTGTIDFGTTGALTIGSANGDSQVGGTLTGTGTLTKTGTGTLELISDMVYQGELALNGGTLALNGHDFTVANLHITGDSIIDFANLSNSILEVGTLLIDAGKTLTILNWTAAADYFYAQNWAGVTQDTSGGPITSQIVFSPDWPGTATAWHSTDNHISPIPEPSTYGALSIGALTAFVFWRRYRRKS